MNVHSMARNWKTRTGDLIEKPFYPLQNVKMTKEVVNFTLVNRRIFFSCVALRTR